MNTINTSSKISRRSFILCSAVAYLLPLHAWNSRCAIADEDSLARQRAAMVERDLRQRGIKDERVLAAMASLPRHLFVPERQRASAYEDRPLPIGDGQTISQPYIVALMTELLELRGRE